MSNIELFIIGIIIYLLGVFNGYAIGYAKAVNERIEDER